ncbi:MAG: PucR family transcriptional regulator ligand-binding domain-containing protein [Desulfobacterales bacterium]|jgi:predicted transcriptional regulator|nr:PucR family transcriptional regulator ligand-binding domain-containing protein [Desulfobacterales bacterium]
MMTKKLNNKMNLAHIKNVLEAEVLCGHDYLDKEIKMAYASDLMSDVLAFVKSGSFLLTGLTNSQVIRTAEMAEISAVCFVNGKTPQPDTINLADEKKIPLIVTKLLMYECCGRLHEKGLASDDDSEKIES